MTQWADYRGGRPSGAALKAAGFSGVIRYIGLGSAGKRITGPEYRDLVNSGVQVLLVAELGTGDAWAAGDDYAAGRANAQAALTEARAIGIPDSVGIAAAADAHAANQQQISDAVAYVRGFRDVLGLARTGFYGFAETLNAVHDAGVASWFWRCGSQPSPQEKTWVTFWQRNTAPTTRTVSGVICDINEQYHPVTTGSTGGGVQPVSATPIQEEEDMITVPPGIDEHVNLIVKGKTELYVGCSWNRQVKIHNLYFYGPTGNDPQGTGVGGGIENTTIDPNRPGPLPIPAHAVMATMRYTADHDFAVGAA